jgi:hypothetical protein
VALNPNYSDLLPYVDLESSPARVRSRTITDVAAGYQYVNIDDCWMNGRDSSGRLQWNTNYTWSKTIT